MAIRLVISGCSGLMGSRIAALAAADAAFAVAGALEAPGHRAVGHDVGALIGGKPLGVQVTDHAKQALAAGDVLIEFTHPEATLQHLEAARAARKPMVIGTTGLTDAQRAAVTQAARDIAIVFSPNMSLGVNVLFELAQAAARQLGPSYDVEIVEAHHRTKKDAPSGTAKRLMEAVADGRNQQPDQIPVHAIRAGDIVGDHTVVFAGPSERLELTHRAQSRDVFAQGALEAARFVVTQSPGLYDMSHVLKGRSRS